MPPLIGRAVAGVRRRPGAATLLVSPFIVCGLLAVRLIPWLLDGSLAGDHGHAAPRIVSHLVVLGLPAFVLLMGLWALGTLAGPTDGDGGPS